MPFYNGGREGRAWKVPEERLMSEENRKDIRLLLKRFGVQADEAIVRHLAVMGDGIPLRLRCTLEDLTDYGDQPPSSPLSVVAEGEIRTE